MKRKNQYIIAVAILLIATAFSACNGKSQEIIPIEDTNPTDFENAVTSVDTQEQINKNENTDSNSVLIEENEASLIGDKELANDDKEEKIFVYVCGAVNIPDVYELPEGARIVDAIKAAGGLQKGSGEKYLNLASLLKDGDKVYIPTEIEIEEAFSSGEEYVGSVVSLSGVLQAVGTGNSTQDNNANSSESLPGNGTANTDNTSGKININQASETELMTLPGIGESKAKKIIEYREANGGFETIEDIMLIPGIKDGMFAKIKDQISVN